MPPGFRRRAPALILALLFLPFVPGSLQGQIGVHGGWVSSSVDVEGAAEEESLNGLNLGASYTFALSPLVGLEVGGDYTEKGGIARDPAGALALDFAYLEIPVLFRLGTELAPGVGVHGRAGPVISVEISCDAELAAPGEGVATGPCSNTESVDIGAALGGGISVRVADGIALTGDVLYNLGLRSASEVGDTRNRALLVQGGLRLTPGG